MTRNVGLQNSTARLRWTLGVFFIALALPAVVLVYSSYRQLKWEAFHQQRTAALELTQSMNRDIQTWLSQEESRSFADYQFLVVTGDSTTNFLQPSALAATPPPTALPGAVGYFQVDANGRLSSPMLPGSAEEAARYGISSAEFERRQQRYQRIQQILSDNRLINPRRQLLADNIENVETDAQAGRDDSPSSEVAAQAPSPLSEAVATEQISSRSELREVAQAEPQAGAGQQSQQAFDALLRDSAEPQAQRSKSQASAPNQVQEPTSAATQADKPLSKAELEQSAKKVPPRQPRKEQSLAPQPQTTAPAADVVPITVFESEVDPFVMSMLDSGHLVLFRKVWREGERFTQGLLLNREEFLRSAVLRPFAGAALSEHADLAVAFRDQVVARAAGNGERGRALRGDSYLNVDTNGELAGEPLLQTSLAEPFNHIRLSYSSNALPLGPGGRVIAWTAVVMAAVLALGTLLMYRLGRNQIRLAQQQQDFVSAVSHELKTPLTSIRMYGEMLRAGWADEDKKRQYYDYIYDESERLSRLITNVLQLARMNRRELDLVVKAVPVNELLDNLESKLATQVERAGFELILERDDALASTTVQVDQDSFLQVIINLVDNALKFSRHSEIKKIEVGATAVGDGEVMFSVRDYGPGVAKSHLKKIFHLFYRGENELTRETVGTGIGLALVHQLVSAMGGRVDVVNRERGAEFRIFLQR